MSTRPHRGAEAAALEPYIGRWVAQDGLEVLYDADSPYDVVRWLRTNGLRATVWKVPATPEEAGSMLYAVKIAYRELPHEINGWPRPLLDVSSAMPTTYSYVVSSTVEP
jgi:hypothetical protein